MKHFTDTGCDAIAAASLAIDKAIVRLDALPEDQSMRLQGIIERMSAIVNELDNILHNEQY